jgi:hypothetical protein
LGINGEGASPIYFGVFASLLELGGIRQIAEHQGHSTGLILSNEGHDLTQLHSSLQPSTVLTINLRRHATPTTDPSKFV